MGNPTLSRDLCESQRYQGTWGKPKAAKGPVGNPKLLRSAWETQTYCWKPNAAKGPVGNPVLSRDLWETQRCQGTCEKHNDTKGLVGHPTLPRDLWETQRCQGTFGKPNAAIFVSSRSLFKLACSIFLLGFAQVPP